MLSAEAEHQLAELQLAPRGRLEGKVSDLEDLEDQLNPTMMQNNVLMSKLDAMYLLIADAVSTADEILVAANEAAQQAQAKEAEAKDSATAADMAKRVA